MKPRYLIHRKKTNIVPRGGKIHSTEGDYIEEKCEPRVHLLTLQTPTLFVVYYAKILTPSSIT